MKRIAILLTMLLAGAFLSIAMAQQGPLTATHPQATATQCAAATPVAGNQTQLLAASTPLPPDVMVAPRICYMVQNFSTSIPVAAGDSVSATQGTVLNAVPAAQPTGSAGGSATICVTSVLNVCGIGGSAVVGATEINR